MIPYEKEIGKIRRKKVIEWAIKCGEWEKYIQNYKIKFKQWMALFPGPRKFDKSEVKDSVLEEMYPKQWHNANRAAREQVKRTKKRQKKTLKEKRNAYVSKWRRMDRERKREKIIKLETSKFMTTENNLLPEQSLDILEDIKWVYVNMPKLFVINNNTKLEELNKEILKKAPSTGAIAMANYALRERSKFFEKFVLRILPKDVGVEDVSEPDISEVDPTFSEIEKYGKDIK